MRMNEDGNLPGFASATISGLYDVQGGAEALSDAIERCRWETDEAIAAGARVIMLSDRHSTAERAPIPSLLLTSAMHQHLVRRKSRTKVALVVESGDAREVHHVALLLGYGAGAVNPYLALESGRGPRPARPAGRRDAREGGQEHGVRARQGRAQGDEQDGHLHRRLLPAAQVFAVFGIDSDVLDEYFTGTTTRTGGSGLATIAGDVQRRHALAFVPNPRTLEHRGLEIGGQYQWRREGEIHLFNPETVYLLQHSTRSKQESVFRRYARTVDELSRKGGTLRGLFELRTGERPPVPLDEVEPAIGDRQAVRHRCDVVRLDLDGGAPDARHRDEPARRQVQHRRGRRGRRAAARPGPPVGDQAGGVRPLRGDQRLPGQRGRDPDQDGAGRQARRGRPAARQQGLPVDRRHPARHRGGRADLAAAAPRHLLHRGSQAADPRPAQRQPAGRGVGQAGLGARCRHRRRRRDQGARRQGDRRRPRRRHRRGAR